MRQVRRASQTGGPDRRWAPRIAFGGLAHETNTFSPVPTTLESFRRRALLTGEAILRQSRIGRGVLGGIVDGIEASGAIPLPLVFASAPPAGLVEWTAFASLSRSLLERLNVRRREFMGIDGVVLALHGAMVVDGEDDPERVLLQETRSAIGLDTPLVVVVDSHASLSAAAATIPDLLVAYDTYPHLDAFERGREAALGCLAIRRGALTPRARIRRLPLIVPLPALRTDGETAMAEVMTLVAALERQAGVVVIAIAGGFPFADAPRTGVSVTVTADGDPRLAEETVNQVASAIWARRAELTATGITPDSAIDRALAAPRGKPTILADVADNPGAGAPGDGTHLLARLLDRGVTGAVVASLADPRAVAAAVAVGAGAAVRLPLGGTVDPRGGPPLDVTATVVSLHDGITVNQGPIGQGGIVRYGRTAVLRIGGIDVIACERPVQVSDPALFAMCGIDPGARRIVVVKSSVHFRAAFAALAGSIVEVEAGGLSSSDLAAFDYRRVRRPIAPLDAVFSEGRSLD